ncbi:MAG: HTH-type transcriptional regulator DegA [candidate division TA06 bacterium ADurb.Bin417]|uniref:HTH-type transcriptional regulator DegA n=1 Tax=candidate division TA06 bacterium ADurb.Bin417 TaxID=1852828 RepID=A0A1V5MKN3_UNCT6|nr:MAG: HTH-type transcriptional regulator DegA [candidate division TA06 bacterium ADurb.Bin417]
MEKNINKRHKSLWKSVMEDLNGQLDNFKYGDRFYTIADICRKYGVSQITAVKALSELEQQGLVQKIRRRGTIVTARKGSGRLWLIIPGVGGVEKSLYRSVVWMKIYQGLVSQAAKIGFEFCGPISDANLTSLSLSGDKKAGFFVIRNLEPRIKGFLQEYSLPCVLLHPDIEDADTCMVKVNRKRGGFLATEHLAGLGHKRIGLMIGSITSAPYLPRFQGYQQALRRAGLKFDWSLVKETSGFDPAEDSYALDQILAKPDPPTAFFAANYSRALNLLQYCQLRKIRVPENLSIAAYDNFPEMSISQPPLTTIETNLEEVGATGVNLMAALMRGERLQPEVVVETELVVRASARPLKA